MTEVSGAVARPMATAPPASATAVTAAATPSTTRRRPRRRPGLAAHAPQRALQDDVGVGVRGAVEEHLRRDAVEQVAGAAQVDPLAVALRADGDVGLDPVGLGALQQPEGVRRDVAGIVAVVHGATPSLWSIALRRARNA